MGPPRICLQVFSLSGFPRHPKITTQQVLWVFPATLSDETRWNRCAIDTQSFPNFSLIKNVFLFVVGGLAGEVIAKNGLAPFLKGP
jgi:hypothetical protein